jgi:ParB family chromosome partitioning protein
MVVSIALASIDIGDNVRVNIEAIDELATSIAEHGVLQPIKVRPHGERFEVVWGQRRVLASRKAGLERIPALITTTDQAIADRSIEQLIENLHRADLNPIDRAQAMKAVVASGVSQADLARSLGLAPSTVANDLGLLEAPEKVRTLVEQGELSPSHAKALKGLAPSSQAELATSAAKGGWSAHYLEQEVQRHKQQEAWRQERQEAEQKRHDESAARLEDQLGNLAKKKIPTDARIVVVSWPGTGLEALVKRIQDRGYPNVEQGSERNFTRRSGSVGCDCSLWLVDQEYDRLVIVPGCANPKHVQAKGAADEVKRKAKYALEAGVQAHVARTASGWAIPGAGAIALDRILAEASLWSLLNYRLPEWSLAHGGTRTKPWQAIHALSDADLATELAKAIAGDFRDHAGYHVDWDGLATELGVEAPA